MSKNKKNKKVNQGYDQKELDEIADCLEEYIDIFDTFIYKEGTKKEEYKKAMKTVKKAIKNLRRGDGDAVFDKERYEEMMQRKYRRCDNDSNDHY